jgi:hypothetical protein
MKYRPEAWNNPYGGKLSCDYEKNIFEAGADAMLEALLSEAQAYNETANHYVRHDDYLCDVLALGVKL